MKNHLFSFLYSWYGNILSILLLALLSTGLLTFFVTEGHLLKEMDSFGKLKVLLMNGNLMVVGGLCLALTLFCWEADVDLVKAKPWRSLARLLLYNLLISGMGALFLQTMYLEVLKVDLLDSGYFMHGFLLLFFLFGAQLCYYLLRKGWEDMRGEAAIAKAERLDKADALQRVSTLEGELAAIQQKALSIKDTCKACAKYMKHSWRLVEDMKERIEVSFDDTSFEEIQVRFIMKVYLEGTKYLRGILFDGKKVLLKGDSLIELQRRYPTIFIKSQREELINVLAVKELFREKKNKSVDLIAVGKSELGKSFGSAITDYEDFLLMGVKKSSELPKKVQDSLGCLGSRGKQL